MERDIGINLSQSGADSDRKRHNVALDTFRDVTVIRVPALKGGLIPVTQNFLA